MSWLSFLGFSAVRKIQRKEAAGDELYPGIALTGIASGGNDIYGKKVNSNGKISLARSLKQSVIFVSISFAACLLGVYLAMFPPLSKDFWDFMMFPPTKAKVDMGRQLQRMSTVLHCHVSDLFFQAPDGARLHAYYFTLPNATKTMLVSHGKGGIIAHRLPLAFLLMRAGCSVFLYDYEGYGESTGAANLPSVCTDGEAAFDYLTQVAKIKPADIILYGESIGTGVTCELSQHRLAGGIILQSGFTSLYEAAKKVVPIVRIYPQWSFPSPQMNNAQILKKPHPPLLFIHGLKDQTLPCAFSEQMMIEASPPKRLIVLPHADHNDVGALDVPETIKAVKDFVSELK